MTESEAIKELHAIRPRGGIIPQKRAEALDVAIQALEEVQQYRAIGTPEECRASVKKQNANQVVEQLEAYSNADEAERLGTMPVVELTDAIKIVEGGGIDGKKQSQ